MNLLEAETCSMCPKILNILYFSLGHLSTILPPKATDAEYQQMLQGVSVLMADRKDPASLKAALGSAGKFDIVFDNNVRKLNEVQPLVEGIQSTGGCEQFILMSSAGVYGPTDVLPLSEENPGDPNSRHKEKLQCEARDCWIAR